MKPKLTLPGGRGGRSCLRRAWGRRSRTSPVGSGHTRRGTCTCMLARIQGLGCEPRNHCKEREQMWPGRLWRRVRVRRRLMDRWPWRRWPSFSFPILLSAPMHPNDPPTNASRQASRAMCRATAATGCGVRPCGALVGMGPPVTWLPPLATPPSNSASRACSLHAQLDRRMQAGNPAGGSLVLG